MIKINWADIKKDVQKQTWRLAKVLLQDDELIYVAQEDDTIASVNFIMRFAEEGYSIVVTKIREAIEYSNADVSDDSIDRTKVGWTITFKEDGVNERALAILIHKFIVDYILHRWCNLWFQKSSDSYKESCAMTISEICDLAFDIAFPTKQKRPQYDLLDTNIEATYE